MTLREKVLIVADAMAMQKSIWLEGVEQKPTELSVMPVDNVVIRIKTTMSDCDLSGVDISDTPPRMTTVGDRRKEFAWLTCGDAVETLEEFTLRCKAMAYSQISANARECMRHILKVIRAAMPPARPDDGRLVKFGWHSASHSHQWTAEESERSKKIHGKFVWCVAELLQMGIINLDEDGK